MGQAIPKSICPIRICWGCRQSRCSLCRQQIPMDLGHSHHSQHSRRWIIGSLMDCCLQNSRYLLIISVYRNSWRYRCLYGLIRSNTHRLTKYREFNFRGTFFYVSHASSITWMKYGGFIYLFVWVCLRVELQTIRLKRMSEKKDERRRRRE